MAGSGIHERLADILDSVADGITVQEPDGRVVYANATALRLIGFESLDDLLATPPAEITSRFTMVDEAGNELSAAALPGRCALAGDQVAPATIGFQVKGSPDQRWALVRAEPFHDDTGQLVFAINTFHDITERVRMESELRASEARHRLLVDAMPVIAWTTDAQGQLDQANQRWIDYTGLSREDAAAVPADETIHPDDRPALIERWAVCLSDGKPLEAESRIRGADGSYRWHLVRAVPIRGEDGSIQGWVGTSTDIDDAHAARRAAEASAARTNALQRLTVALARASTRQEIVDIAVRDALDVFGAAGAVLFAPADDGRLELIGSGGYPSSDTDALRLIDPNDKLPVAEAFVRREAVWLPDVETSLGGDARIARARARVQNASLCAVPLLVEGRAVGVVGLAFRTRRDFELADRDLLLSQAAVLAQAFDRVMLGEARERLLADLEEQRNRLVGLIDQMPAGVVIADADGTISLANRHAGDIWRQPVPTNRPVTEYREFEVFGRDGERYRPDRQPLSRALSTGETISGEQVRIRRFDGTDAWIAVDAAPITDRDGRILAAVSTFTDVTAQHLAAERQAFLAEASALLASSLDYEETIARIARLAVPRLADWCGVDLVGPSGALDQIAVAHVDPARVELARALRERYPPRPDAETGVGAVIREGRSELVSEIPADLVDGIPDPELRRITRELELRSYMCVPLITGGTTIGAITFVGAESGLRYTTDDLPLAEELAGRAAAAIANARLFRDVGRYKRILDATLDAVFMFDPETLRFSYVNQGAIDQVGLDRPQLLGLTPAAFVVDFDEARIRDLIAPLVTRRLDSRTVILAHRHTSGRRIPVEVLFQHVELPGEAGRIVAVARDISDRVEAQARLQRLAEAEHARAAELNAVIRTMGEGVVVCDPEGRVSLANPAAEQLFPDVASGDYASILAALDDPDGRAPALGARGGPVELKVRGGDERWVELSTYPVAGRGGYPSEGVDETIVLARDVTQARQQQAVRDTFIGVLSHELRTPVTTIYAGSKVLARGQGLDDDVRRSVFEDIHVEAERLHRLVEDVIALTRFGEQDGDVGSEPLLLQRTLPGVVRSEEARWPGVRFDLRVPTGLPTVIADPTYVEQVIRNLLSNAAKYGGPGSRVEAIVEPGDGEVIVRILDDGPGFPPDEADRLFDLFFRSPSTAAAASGAGIGLFVCARLIRAMGGRIWARPRGDRGAEFGFSLRVMPDD